MSYALTPNLGLFKPMIDADDNLWGGHLNSNADVLDTAVVDAARASGVINVRDLGIICDGVTDQGAQLNAALTASPPGTIMFIPASLYTTQTITIANGRGLVMRDKTMVRPVVGSLLLECTAKIIGSSTVSPVILCTGNECSLDGVNISRTGTPAAGTIGLQCIGQNHLYTRVHSYNHGRCIQVGALRAAPVTGGYVGITMRFDHCIVWRGYEAFMFLINAPETTCYDMRFGINGEADPSVPTALLWIDGDHNFGSDAGTTNTVNFIRAQFNSSGNHPNTVYFNEYNSPDGWLSLVNCYSGGAQTAFLRIDPNCTSVRHITLVNNYISPLKPTETFFSDTGVKVSSFEMIGNHIAGGPAQPAAGFSLVGVSAVMIGNIFNGGFTARLDSLTGGVILGNTVNTLEVVGTFTGNPTLINNNNAAVFTQTATGAVSYVQANGNYGQQLVIGKTGQGGRIDLRRGVDGALHSYIGYAGAIDPNVDVTAISGGALVRLNGQAADVFLVNGTEMARVDTQGFRMAPRQGAAVAPGAQFGQLQLLPGTTAGTAKLVVYAGTSTTPVTIADNIGAGF